jgi:hypothetical protein
MQAGIQQVATGTPGLREKAPGRVALSILEIVGFGIASIILVIFVIPSSNGVETFCFLDGPETAAADRYATTMFFAGFASWLAMIPATIMAFRLRRPNLGIALPLGWFVAVVAIAAVATRQMGPQPCQGGFGFF